jgi:hypothetical protein
LFICLMHIVTPPARASPTPCPHQCCHQAEFLYHILYVLIYVSSNPLAHM